jgi:hypothetical protein
MGDLYDDYDSDVPPRYGLKAYVESNAEEVLDALDDPKVIAKIEKIVRDIMTRWVKDAKGKNK